MHYTLSRTLLTVSYEFDSLRFERINRKRWMFVFYRMAVHATLELYCFFLFFLTSTEGKKFFSTKFCSMDHSFRYKFFENSIECCWIHLSCFDEFCFEFRKTESVFFLKWFQEMTAMDSRKHKKLQNYFWSIVCIFLQMQIFIFLEDRLSYDTGFAALDPRKCLHHGISICQASMLIIDCTTVLAECNSYSITGSSITTLTREYESFSSNSHLMNQSLTLESVDDTIESCQIHAWISFSYEFTLEISKSYTWILTEYFNEPFALFGDTSIWHRGG